MHFCAWFFAAVLLYSLFLFLQDLTTAEDEERTPGNEDTWEPVNRNKKKIVLKRIV